VRWWQQLCFSAAAEAAVQRRRRQWQRCCGAYPQNIELPIKIIAINCQLKLIAGLEKRQLIAVSPTII
jgi:hypothetical protein